jgi:hypothetical protein
MQGMLAAQAFGWHARNSRVLSLADMLQLPTTQLLASMQEATTVLSSAQNVQF